MPKKKIKAWAVQFRSGGLTAEQLPKRKKDGFFYPWAIYESRSEARKAKNDNFYNDINNFVVRPVTITIE